MCNFSPAVVDSESEGEEGLSTSTESVEPAEVVVVGSASDEECNVDAGIK